MDIKELFKAGGSFVSVCPQFSFNSENIYVAWKNKILGYNSKTGILFAEFKGIKDPIVGFGVHYYESFECITACSNSGEIITWKVVTHFKMLNKKIGAKYIETFHIVPFEMNEIKALISCKDTGRVCFTLIHINTGKKEHYSQKINTNFYKVDICGDKYFAVIQKNLLHVYEISNFSKRHTFCIDQSRQFTCVACHPEDETILTGDSTGRVVIWHRIFTSKPSQGVFHWHTLPVKCLSFSTAGSYFYSGGDESVLVRWQIKNHLEKTFLPRLPSSIAQISVSPNNNFIAIATDDNAIKIVDARFENISLIQHLVIGNHYESGMIFDPRSKSLVLNGNIGQIQLYSPQDNSLLYSVDVVGQNKITNERNCNIENTQVSKVAISKSGLWMATVETRKDPEYSSEVRLKFWKFDLEIQNFKLNSSVEYPHENHVNSLAFQPCQNESELKCITVGGDKKFKIWTLSQVTMVEKTKQVWMCLCTGFYHDLPCKSLSFSIDGSLAAISFNDTITTWLPDSCQLKCSLLHSIYKQEIQHLAFGNSSQCHLIVAATTDRLSVWNLLTLTMIWTVPVEVSLLVADTITTNMAIITNDKNVYVFAPASPEPLYSSDKILKNHKDIYTAAFVPSKYHNDARLEWYQRSPIFFIDSNRELFCLGLDEELTETSIPSDEIQNSLFSMTIPQNYVSKIQPEEAKKHMFEKDTTQKSLKKYLEAPLQTMVPVRFMCSSFLRGMVLQKI